MKTISKFVFLIVLLIFSYGLTACDNGGSSSDGQARTENDFVNEPGLMADPENDLVVMFLESPGPSEQLMQGLHTGNDIGEQGIDKFSYRYERDVNHTVCWEDDNEEAAHTVTHINSDGEEVFEAVANGGCVSEIIPAGDYDVIITHDGLSDSDPIFFRPQSNTSISSKKTVLTNMFLVKTGEILNLFKFTKNSYAQSDDSQDNVSTLLTTNKCTGCDLSNADLQSAGLTEADLSGANMFGVNAMFADFTGANLTQTDLRDSNISASNLEFADLTGANLTSADLTRSSLGSAVLTGAVLNGTNLSLVLWCDGNCDCADNSFDTCGGCDSVDICTGS